MSIFRAGRCVSAWSTYIHITSIVTPVTRQQRDNRRSRSRTNHILDASQMAKKRPDHAKPQISFLSFHRPQGMVSMGASHLPST